MWSAEGIILHKRVFAEDKYIVTLFSRDLGKSQGMIRKSTNMPGDLVSAVWSGRSGSLGFFKFDTVYSAFLHIAHDALRLYCLQAACDLCMTCMQTNDAHPALFESLQTLLCEIGKNQWLLYYVFFELELLHEIGFGLALYSCAVNGSTNDLLYISPKTGRAVSRQAGEAYRDKLFKMPSCFQSYISSSVLAMDNATGEEECLDATDILTGLEITRYFLQKHVVLAVPQARLSFEKDLRQYVQKSI